MREKVTHPLHRLTHPQPCHHNTQPPPRKPTDPNLPLHLAEPDPLTQDSHRVQLLQQQLLMLQANGVGGFEVGEGVRERLEGAAKAVVFRVVRGRLNTVAAAGGGGEVRGIGLIGREVDFAEESGEVSLRRWGKGWKEK